MLKRCPRVLLEVPEQGSRRNASDVAFKTDTTQTKHEGGAWRSYGDGHNLVWTASTSPQQQEKPSRNPWKPSYHGDSSDYVAQWLMVLNEWWWKEGEKDSRRDGRLKLRVSALENDVVWSWLLYHWLSAHLAALSLNSGIPPLFSIFHF